MKRSKIILLILAYSLLFAACSGIPVETQPIDSAPPHPAPMETTVHTEPSTEPKPTEPPETEPPLVLDIGPKVYINGIAIEDTVLHNDIFYLNAAQFCDILGGSSEGSESTFNRNDISYTFSSSYSHMLVDSKAVIPAHPVLNYNGKAYLSLDEMGPALDFTILHDPEAGAIYCAFSDLPTEISKNRSVPVFMYHAVDNNLWGIAELFVKPEMMEAHLKYLSENGYDTIFFEDLYHLEDYDKPVILTFDDGYMDNYTQLFPLLKKYNCKATVFIIDNMINVDNKYLTTDQILEMADSGLVSIQSHTVTHPDLDSLNLEEQRRELEDSRLLTARLSHRIPTVLCYPTGKYNDNTLKIIDQYYLFGIKMNGGLYNTSDDPYLIKRYYVARSDSLYWFTSTLEGIFD